MQGWGTVRREAKRAWKGLEAVSDLIFKRSQLALLAFVLTSIFVGAIGTALWPPTVWIVGGVWLVLSLPFLVEMRDLLFAERMAALPVDFWWPNTPLSRPDPEAPILPEFTDGPSLHAAFPDWRPQHPHGRYAALFVPAYGKRMRFWVHQADPMSGFLPSTVRTITDIVGWTAEDRAAIRALLVESAARDGEAGGPPVTLSEVEDLVVGAVVHVEEDDETRARFATMELETPWVGGHPTYVIVRDGRPVAISAYDAFVGDYELDAGA